MSQWSQRFSSYDDIHTRPAFDPHYEISPSNFHVLVGKYSFGEKHICQVRTDRGVCHQKHFNGWLGVSIEGVEALIGGDCATNYFLANDDFIRERNRVNDELDRKDAIENISVFLTNKFKVVSDLVEIEKLATSVYKKISDIYNYLPSDALKFISNSQKVKKWDVFVDVQHINTVDTIEDDDTQKEYWTKASLGWLKAIPSEQEVKSLLEKIKQLIKFYNVLSSVNLDELSEIKTSELKKKVKRLELKSDYAGLSESYSKDVNSFLKEPNMELLVYVCGSTKEQFYATQAIMKLSGLKASHNTYIERRLSAIKDKYESKFDGKYIRKSI